MTIDQVNLPWSLGNETDYYLVQDCVRNKSRDKYCRIFAVIVWCSPCKYVVIYICCLFDKYDKSSITDYFIMSQFCPSLNWTGNNDAFRMTEATPRSGRVISICCWSVGNLLSNWVKIKRVVCMTLYMT